MKHTTKSWRDYDFSRVANGRLFFYIGAGLSRAAGLVGWKEMAEEISQFRRSYEGDRFDRPPEEDQARENAAYLRRFIEEKDSTGRPILSHGSESTRTFGRTVFLNFLLRCKKGEFDQPPGSLQLITEDDLELHAAVWKAHPQGVLTTNYDMLMEEAFGLVTPSKRIGLYGHPASLRTYRYYARFLRFLLSVPRFVLKLHGDIDDIGTMLFDPDTAWNCGQPLGGTAGRDLCRAFDAALQVGHIVYIGCGGRDRTFRRLHTWPSRAKSRPYQRLFFAPSGEVENIVKDMGIATENLTFLTYDSSRSQIDSSFATSELRCFLEELARRTGSRPHLFSEEAASIWNQIASGRTPRREWITKEWDLAGKRLHKS